MTPSISRTDLAAQRVLDEVIARTEALTRNPDAVWPGYTPWAQAYESVTGKASTAPDYVLPGIDRLARAVTDWSS